MNEVLSGKRDLKPEEQTCLASGYDGGIAYLDSQIRELVGSLRSRGLYDNTLLIITGDHGEALGQRNQIGHGGISVYQNEVGVPLLVKYPGMHAGSQVDAVASQVDFLSTVLDVASIPEPAGLQGISLRKLDRDPSRFVVSVSYPHPWLVGLNRQYDRVEQALVFGDKKLVQSNTGKQELFNLSSDAKEEHNLYREGPSETNELAEMLQSWVRHIPALIPEDRGAPDRSTVERLKSLGYAQ
jgi:arylsulfatase A-like enzyme